MSANILPDRRVRRSHHALWTALLDLLHDVDWHDISVQMICDRADVARSTFYAHFAAKQDLLDSGFAATAAEIGQAILHTPPQPGQIRTIHWLIGHVASGPRFLRRVQGSASGQVILTRFRLAMTNVLMQELARAGHAPNKNDLTFAAGGIFAAIDRWIAEGQTETSGAVIQRLQRQTNAVLGTLNS